MNETEKPQSLRIKQNEAYLFSKGFASVGTDSMLRHINRMKSKLISRNIHLKYLKEIPLPSSIRTQRIYTKVEYRTWFGNDKVKYKYDHVAYVAVFDEDLTEHERHCWELIHAGYFLINFN